MNQLTNKESIKLALSNRFGADRIKEILTTKDDFPLLLLSLDPQRRVSVLMTSGLSSNIMPVPEKHADKARIELYFCLPEYWDYTDPENATMNWMYHWINRLAKYVSENNTWLGHGHTIDFGSDAKQLVPLIRQTYFFLSDPTYLKGELAPLNVGDQMVHFLAIIPIFSDEMDYKHGKGTRKFEEKLRQHGVTEKLDEYRGSVLKSKWRFFRK
jgi:hypothetical protein